MNDELMVGRAPDPVAASPEGGMDEDVDASFDDFYAGAVGSLLRLAFARTGSWVAAEDLAQDAMADAHRRWAEVSRLDNPTTWVRRAVLNRSISVLRRRGREQRALERVAARSDATAALPALADEELWAAIRELSPRQLHVVLLLWFEDLPVTEVAATLDCGEETVRTHWRRARAHLARALGEPDDEAEPSDGGAAAEQEDER